MLKETDTSDWLMVQFDYTYFLKYDPILLA